MISKTDKGNTIVILPIQQYDMKIQNFITENHFQTINTDRTKIFQNQIRNTVNNSKTPNPQNSKWKYINLNPSVPSIIGLIKTYKPNLLIRPVLKGRNAPAYILSKLFTLKINQLTSLP
jgi:hypothetical protein